eukprot:scaffold7092_cov262-Pinguiococcus_pyrenoidosus.AAC.39
MGHPVRGRPTPPSQMLESWRPSARKLDRSAPSRDGISASESSCVFSVCKRQLPLLVGVGLDLRLRDEQARVERLAQRGVGLLHVRAFARGTYLKKPRIHERHFRCELRPRKVSGLQPRGAERGEECSEGLAAVPIHKGAQEPTLLMPL